VRPNSPPTFDYVIVGAGSSGCVLANRLSADPAIQVCLLEAGPEDTSPLIHVPLALPALFEHPKLNWRFTSTPQAAAGGRSIYVPRGKVLGGSSAVNGMVYHRGHPADYDGWLRAGNAGWGYEDVLPYFVRSENNAAWRASRFHGTSGPMNVRNLTSHNPATKRFIQAGISLGFPVSEDFNGALPEGFGYRQVTQIRGRRETAATAFLGPARHRPNLRIITGALVDRIEFEGRRAVGASYLLGNERHYLRARSETVVAAGVFGSPTILLRSGLGDASQLQEFGIDVVAHLPGVGANLQDHQSVAVSYETEHPETYGISLRSSPRLVLEVLRYVLFRTGMVASNILEGSAYIRSDSSVARPDIQFSFMPARRNPSRTIGLGHGYSVSAVVLQPKGRGSVRLSGPSPTDAPLIDIALFSHLDDVALLVKGVRLARRVLTSAAFADYRGRESKPGLQVASDSELIDYIRKNGGTTFHPVGTCAMGASPLSVVDSRLSVRGVADLRVVDASIMPTIVAGNTHAPTVMIAEKGADLILSALKSTS
jgi:choline dehydrogenase